MLNSGTRRFGFLWVGHHKLCPRLSYAAICQLHELHCQSDGRTGPTGLPGVCSPLLAAEPAPQAHLLLDVVPCQRPVGDADRIGFEKLQRDLLG